MPPMMQNDLVVPTDPDHTTKANLITTDPKTGLVTKKEVEIRIGAPEDGYIMISPKIGCVLAGRTLPRYTATEVPLIFFHDTKHFACGNSTTASLLLMKLLNYV
jgi:hypothetical protein